MLTSTARGCEWDRTCPGNVILALRQIQFAPDAVDEVFAFSRPIRFIDRVAESKSGVTQFVHNDEAYIESGDHPFVSAKFREVAEVELQRINLDRLSGRTALIDGRPFQTCEGNGRGVIVTLQIDASV